MGSFSEARQAGDKWSVTGILFWSAVINGVVAVPLLVVVILPVSNRKVMGDFIARAPIRWLGWATVAVMAAAAGAMVVPLF